MSRLDPELRQILLEMRDILWDMQKDIEHLLEQNRFSRSIIPGEVSK
jgi:hypothetical protein